VEQIFLFIVILFVLSTFYHSWSRTKSITINISIILRNVAVMLTAIVLSLIVPLFVIFATALEATGQILGWDKEL